MIGIQRKTYRYLWMPFLLLSAHAIADQLEASGAHVRILAASCATCHGTDGNSVGGTPVLAGLDKTYFLAQMQGFRSGEIPATVMHHHAKGLTIEEIELLAQYFSQTPKKTGYSPRPLGEGF